MPASGAEAESYQSRFNGMKDGSTHQVDSQIVSDKAATIPEGGENEEDARAQRKRDR